MLLSTLATTAILIGSSQPSQSVISPPQATTPTATAESIEILRRILSDAVDKAFDTSDEAGGPGNLRFGRAHAGEVRGLLTTMWAAGSTVTHSRAFHVPSRGLFFSLDVRLPTVTREPAADERGPEDHLDDEWTRMRLQVRGQGNERYFAVHPSERMELEIDPKAVQTLTDTLIAALGRHASRIEGLDSKDMLTVALHLSGGHEAAWAHWNLMMEDDKEEEATRSYVLALGADVPEQHMVLELSMADIRDGAQGGRLAERARINRY